MLNNIIYLIFSITIISSLLFLINFLIYNYNFNPDSTRKILHISAGIIAIYALYIINEIKLLIYITILILIILIILYQNQGKNKLKKFNITKGIIYYTLSYLFLLIFFSSNKNVITASFSVLVFADSLAAIIGNYVNSRKYNFKIYKKTFLGSLVFFIITLLIVNLSVIWFFPNLYNSTNKVYLNLFILFFAFKLTLIELIFNDGLDNLIVPIYGGLYFYFLLNNKFSIETYILGILLSLLVVVLSLKLKFLTFDGGIATFLLAANVFGLGGIKYTLPIITFFVLSSLLSKVKNLNKKNAEVYYEKSGTRDMGQVIANGGIAGIILIINTIYNDEVFYILYVVAIATVCADTWSTEIGTLFNTNTYNILSLKKIKQGESGGISFIGTIGGILGSIIIFFSAISYSKYNNIIFFLIIFISSFLGNMVDSLLGATLQAKYKCISCGKITESKTHCNKNTKFIKGISIIDNDKVNIIACLIGVLIGLITYKVSL